MRNMDLQVFHGFYCGFQGFAIIQHTLGPAAALFIFRRLVHFFSFLKESDLFHEQIKSIEHLIGPVAQWL